MHNCVYCFLVCVPKFTAPVGASNLSMSVKRCYPQKPSLENCVLDQIIFTFNYQMLTFLADISHTRIFHYLAFTLVAGKALLCLVVTKIQTSKRCVRTFLSSLITPATLTCTILNIFFVFFLSFISMKCLFSLTIGQHVLYLSGSFTTVEVIYHKINKNHILKALRGENCTIIESKCF